MITQIVKLDASTPKQEFYLRQAAGILRSGGLVVIPTETVYGIAANMLNKKAIERLTEIKKRPPDKPYSLLIDKKEKIENYARDIPPRAYKLIDKFWPGPLTIILKSKETNTIGMRLPDNEIALKIIEEAKVPLICPSANLSGKPAPVSFNAAIEDLNGLVDFAIDAGDTKLRIESTVVDLTVEPFKILREGAIKRQAIEDVAEKKTVLFICTGNSCRSVMAEAFLRKKLAEKNRQNVEVSSAGIMMLAGFGATEPTKEILKKEGIDVSNHTSRRVTAEMVKKADLILVMEDKHEEKILQLVPEARNRVFLLKEFAKINDADLNIADPIGRSMEFYEEIFRSIKEAVEKIVQII